MSNFSFLKKYTFEKTFEGFEKNKHAFFKVSDNEIESAEKRLGRNFPAELKQFYKELGYGFVCCNLEGSLFNRLMAPDEINDFRLGKDVFENDERREYYTEENLLVFYEVSEVSCLRLDLEKESKQGQCPVYYEDIKIANSLEEFLERMDLKPNYYLDEHEFPI